MPLTLHSVLAIGYVTVFASILAYLAFNRTIELLGPNTGALTVHLVPVFGTILLQCCCWESRRIRITPSASGSFSPASGSRPGSRRPEGNRLFKVASRTEFRRHRPAYILFHTRGIYMRKSSSRVIVDQPFLVY